MQNQGEWKQISLSKEKSIKEFVAVFDLPLVDCVKVGCVEMEQQRGYEEGRYFFAFAS